MVMCSNVFRSKLEERSFLNSKLLIRVDSTGSYYKKRKTSKITFWGLLLFPALHTQIHFGVRDLS